MSLRMSLVDPWLHEKDDGFPILYVRSHAARLPGGLVRDWLFRCRVALERGGGRLVLKVRSGRCQRQQGGSAAGGGGAPLAWTPGRVFRSGAARLRPQSVAGAPTGDRPRTCMSNGCVHGGRSTPRAKPAAHRSHPCAAPSQELYAHYVQQVKEAAHELPEPHRAILLRKAVHYFNTRRAHLAVKKGEVVAAAESAAAGRPLITVRGGVG